MRDDIQQLLPLKPLILEILLSLAERPSHGYAVMKEIEERSEGAFPARPGAFYRLLGRALDVGLVEELDEAPVDADGSDPRRRYYTLTERGRHVAGAELERLRDAADLGRARGLL